MDQMTIGEVAKKAGIAASTLRYYESIGLLEPDNRVGGQRRYKPHVLERLQIIHVAKQAGFTLSEIGTLMSGFSSAEPPSERWKVMAQKKIAEVDALIEKAQGMKRLLMEGLECDCLRLDECAVFLNGSRKVT
jgi:MerR family redox-sensitive transcriptional activator SoxR